MRSHDYGRDVLSGPKHRQSIPEVPAEQGLVVEHRSSDFCGAIVSIDSSTVTLEDRRRNRRVFPLGPGDFLLEGQPVTLVRPRKDTIPKSAYSASGSVAVAGRRAKTARASRIWVEGLHDAELVERIWGHDLRVEGIVVEPLDGVDVLASRIAEFGAGPQQRLGVLVDHLVPGSKESRLVSGIDHPHVLITGHPYVDVWQAVKPASVGIAAWPNVPKDQLWKNGVCQVLGWGEPTDGWRRILARVRDFRDLEIPLITAVEQLIDFVSSPE